MTSPTGGGANLGTAFGKVRIAYESTGSGRATKDVEAVQQSLVNAGKTADQTTKSLSSAAGSVNQFAAQTAKLGKNVKNPIAGLGKQVENEVQKANRALGDIGKTGPGRAGRKNGTGPGRITITPEVRVDPKSITINQAAINRLAAGTLTQAITLKVPLKIDPSDLELDQSAFQNMLSGMQIDRLVVKAPLTIEPSDVEIDQSGMKAAGAQAGNVAGGAMAGGLMATMARLAPAAAIIAAPVAAVGFTLTQGFSRLQGLDQAAIKLKALGYEANQIKSISDSALKSVEGTAFGLDEAFNTASNAIASGIKPGKDLDKYLNATANTAALAGVSMVELGDAFGQAAIEGKLTGDILQLLYSRNVPVLKLIAEEYGVTQSAARQMVSDGEVEFGRFINAMSQNGDAARIMGNTVAGSFQNMLASIKRTGAAILAPIFGEATGEASTMAQVIQGITDKLKEFEGVVKDNRGTIISFWAGLADVVIGAGHVIVSATAAISAGVGTLAKGLSWVPRLLANINEATGKGDLARDAYAIADAMNEFGSSALDFGKSSWEANGALSQFSKTVDEWESRTRNATGATGGLGDAIGEVEPQAISLREALEKFGSKEGSAMSAIEGTVAEFEKLIEALEKKPGSKALIDTLRTLRDNFDNGGRAAKSYADALRNMGDQTIDASSKADALIASLRQMGMLPGGSGLDNYEDSFRDLISYQANLVDALDTTGNALINLDGTFNTASANGNRLKEVFDEAVSAAYEFAATGEAPPGEIYDETVRRLKYILEQFNITGAAADDFINKNLSPGAQGKAGFEAQFSGKTPQEIIEETFKNDPAKAATVLDLLTTRQDIINEITGGPGSTLKIPAQIDLQDPSAPTDSGWFPQSVVDKVFPGGDPNAPKKDITTANKLPAVTSGPNLRPEGTPGPEKPWWRDPFAAIRENFESGQAGSSQLVLPDSLANASDDQIRELLSQNADIEEILRLRVQAAQEQGKTLSEAFAEGINSSDEAVREAIIRLATLVGDGLGNSPAKYGPLSGKGWTYERGRVFTQAWAQGISSESAAAKSAVTNVAGASVSPFGEGIESLIKDLSEFSSIGRKMFEFAKQIADIGFSIAGVANDLSGGRLFPKTYTRDPNLDTRRGSPLGEFSPTRLVPKGTPSSLTSGRTLAPGKVAPNAKGDDVAKAFIAQAQSRGWNNEQILAGLGVLNQETAFGTNPATNNVQNQNGTPGITGVFQQDMGYRKYGDPRDVNNAITGYITEFENRGGLTADPWDFAVSGVQKPANVGAGGYWDRSGAGAGNYLREKQRAEALEVFNRLTGGGTGSLSVPTVSTALPAQNRLSDTGSVGSNALVRQAYAAVEQLWGDQLRGTFSGSRPVGTSAKGTHDAGKSLDIPIGPEQLALGDEITKFFQDQAKAFGVRYTIFRNQGRYPENPEDVAFNSPGHFNHIDVNFDEAKLDPTSPLGAILSSSGALTTGTGARGASGQPGGLTNLPKVELGPNSLAPLNTTAFNTDGLLGMPSAISDLAKTNPQVAEAIAASQSGSITSDQAIPLLQSLDGAIADQNALNTPQGKAMAESLGRTRSQLMQQTGLQEGPSQLDQAQGIANGVSGIVSSAFAVFDSVIASIGSAKEISGTLVRGVSNTEDIYNIVDEIQSFIELGQNISQLVSDVTGFASSLVGAGAAGDPSGGAAGAAAALGAISGISGIVAQSFAAVNAFIDLGQEVYRMAGKYQGRLLTNWVGLPGATDLQFLLDEVTGQMQVWSSENPQMKTTFDQLGRTLGGADRYGSREATRNEFHIYQGPGQDPRDTMSQAMFAVKTSGVGALGYAS